MAKTDKIKAIHYISTRSVIDSLSVKNEPFLAFSEDSDIYSLDIPNNVYALTKFEGEKLIMNARKEGIPGSIYRIGNLVFNSQTLQHQKNINDNAFYQIINSAINMGEYPKLYSSVEMSCVDDTAKAIVQIASKSELQNQTFHLYNHELTHLGKLLLELPHNCLKLKPLDSFLRYMLIKFNNPSQSHYIKNFMLHMGWLDELKGKTLSIRVDIKTQEVLKKLNFKWHKITSNDLITMRNHTLERRVDFLETVNIFSGVNRETLFEIANYLQKEYSSKAKNLMKEGVRDDSFILVRDGIVDILTKDESNNTLSVALHGRSAVVGLYHVFAKIPATRRAISGSDIIFYRLKRENLELFFKKNPIIAANILLGIEQRKTYLTIDTDIVNKIFVGSFK